MQRILLVDDHEMARKAMKHFLEHHGYACEEAEHGAAALAKLDQGPSVDLIVSDNHMPVMIGMELLVQVKANPHFGSIPFILYSGNITDEMYQRGHARRTRLIRRLNIRGSMNGHTMQNTLPHINSAMISNPRQ